MATMAMAMAMTTSTVTEDTAAVLPTSRSISQRTFASFFASRYRRWGAGSTITAAADAVVVVRCGP
jgi:hypothetical protein